jgi:predicted MFS family arabinose efflux permease
MLSDKLGRVGAMRLALMAALVPGVEGGVILGFLTYLPPALEAGGYNAAASGLAVGLYGLATLGWTWVLKRVADRLGKGALISLGGALLALGYATGAVSQNLLSISLAACLVGGGFPFMHSTLQTWATEVAPEARATMISFFAAALFAGSGLATTAAAPLAGESAFGTLFALAAFVALPLGLLGGLARRRYAFQ